MLKAVGQCFHAHCFRCSTCSCSLEGAPFITDDNNNPYCVQDYHRRFSPLCVSCNEPIIPAAGSEETVRVVALDKNFHLKCYRCEDCARPLSIEADENGCYPLDGRILCMKCHTKRVRQAAQWLAEAASLKLTMNQIQKHRIHSAAVFAFATGLSSVYVCRLWAWMCCVRRYVCMQSSIRQSLFALLQCRSNVLHWNKLPIVFYSQSPTLQSHYHLAIFVYKSIFFCANSVYAKISSITCTISLVKRAVWWKLKLPFFFVLRLHIVSSTMYWNISILTFTG